MLRQGPELDLGSRVTNIKSGRDAVSRVAKGGMVDEV